MWDTYEEYCVFMRSKECEPVSEEIFNRDYRSKTEEEKEAEKLAHIPFVSRKKESFRNVEPTLSNHESPKATPPLKVNLLDAPKAKKEPIKKPVAVKDPPPPMKPRQRFTPEEIKQRRLAARKKKREEFKAQGLTILGKQRVQRAKAELTDEEIRARRVRYAKNYRTKNREKHLQARRDARRRRKESLLQSAANGSVNKSPEPTSAVA